MTSEKLNELIAAGPVELTMTNGQRWFIDGAEFALADRRAVAILHKDEDGQRRLHYVVLQNISSVKPVETAG